MTRKEELNKMFDKAVRQWKKNGDYVEDVLASELDKLPYPAGRITMWSSETDIVYVYIAFVNEQGKMDFLHRYF